MLNKALTSHQLFNTKDHIVHLIILLATDNIIESYVEAKTHTVYHNATTDVNSAAFQCILTTQ